MQTYNKQHSNRIFIVFWFFYIMLVYTELVEMQKEEDLTRRENNLRFRALEDLTSAKITWDFAQCSGGRTRWAGTGGWPANQRWGWRDGDAGGSQRWTLNIKFRYLYYQYCGFGMFSIPDIGSRVKKIPDPGFNSPTKNLNIFNPKNCFQDLGNMIRDVHPGSGSWFITNPVSRIQGSKRHRIPDPDQQHCILRNRLCIKRRKFLKIFLKTVT